MSKDIIPIFSSDASIGKSILTADEPAEIKDDAPISIWSIAKEYELEKVFILEKSFINFINHYKQAQKLNKQLVFGCRFKIVSDAYDQSENSLLTESNINIWMANSSGYNDLIKLYTVANADKNRFYYTGRLQWKDLQQINNNNLSVTIPFYNSFLAQNLLEFKHRAIPEWSNIRPRFHIENHELSFDSIIEKAVLSYVKENKLDVINSHQIYYMRDKDILPAQIMRCIINRSSFDCPDLNHFSSNKFSFESYLNKGGHKLNG